MTIDQVRAIARRANPAPDPDALELIDPLPHFDREGSGIMSTTQIEEIESPTPSGPNRVWLAAAVAVAVLAFGAIAIYMNGYQSDPFAGETPAVAQTMRWVAALDDGNPEAAVDLMGTDENWDRDDMASTVAFLALSAGGYAVEDCVETPGDGHILVTCGSLVIDDPIMEATDLTSLPFAIEYTDGLVLIADLGDRTIALRAFSSYARDFETERFDQVCNSLILQGPSWMTGHVLTADCALLYADLADDVAAWVSAGRPTP